jgi:hypothetical protein
MKNCTIPPGDRRPVQQYLAFNGCMITLHRSTKCGEHIVFLFTAERDVKPVDIYGGFCQGSILKWQTDSTALRSSNPASLKTAVVLASGLDAGQNAQGTNAVSFESSIVERTGVRCDLEMMLVHFTFRFYSGPRSHTQAIVVQSRFIEINEILKLKKTLHGPEVTCSFNEKPLLELIGSVS